MLAASPKGAKRLSALMMSHPPALLRGVGLGAMAAGVVLVWVVRG